MLTDSAAFDSAGLHDTGVNPALMEALDRAAVPVWRIGTAETGPSGTLRL